MFKKRPSQYKPHNIKLANSPSAQVTESVTSKDSPLVKRYNDIQQQMTTRWHALPSRDRLALIILLLFLLLFGGGYGGYILHNGATKSKADYNNAVSDYFWLRAQAGNINAEANLTSPSDNDQTPTAKINTVINQAGIDDAQVVATGETVQLSFSHNSQALVGRVLGKLQQQGWQFSRLTVQQDSASKQLQVQATLSK